MFDLFCGDTYWLSLSASSMERPRQEEQFRGWGLWLLSIRIQYRRATE